MFQVRNIRNDHATPDGSTFCIAHRHGLKLRIQFAMSGQRFYFLPVLCAYGGQLFIRIRAKHVLCELSTDAGAIIYTDLFPEIIIHAKGEAHLIKCEIPVYYPGALSNLIS